MTNNVGLTLVLVTLYHGLQLLLSKRKKELVTVIFIYTVATTLNMTFTNSNCLVHDAEYYKASRDIYKKAWLNKSAFIEILCTMASIYCRKNKLFIIV